MMTGLTLKKPGFFYFARSDAGAPMGYQLYEIIKGITEPIFHPIRNFHQDTSTRHFIIIEINNQSSHGERNGRF